MREAPTIEEPNVGASSEEDSTDELVRAARTGDPSAFRRLVERFHRRIYRWALAGTGDLDEAEDVTQEVLIRLHRHLSDFEGRADFQVWLFRMTRNAAYTAREGARGRAERLQTQAGSSSRGSRAAAALDRIHAGEVAGLVRTYFEELPPRQRQVFQLVDLEGFHPREAAEMLEINPATLRANLFKARRTIRERVLGRLPELKEGYGA